MFDMLQHYDFIFISYNSWLYFTVTCPLSQPFSWSGQLAPSKPQPLLQGKMHVSVAPCTHFPGCHVHRHKPDGLNNRNAFPNSSGGQKFNLSFNGTKSRCLEGHTLSGGSYDESIPHLFWLPVACSLAWLIASSLKPCLHLHIARSSLFAKSPLLPSYKDM